MTAFDEIAAVYDAWYATPAGRLADRLEKAAVFALVPPAPGLALDLSCGTGHYALELRRRGWRVLGVDCSLPMLRVAQTKAPGVGSLGLVCADAAALPLRATELDLVTLVLGLEFVPDPAAVLREVRRVLAPDGVLVVGSLRPQGLWTRWRRLRRRLGPSAWRGARFLDEAGLEQALRRSGFAVRERRRAVHYLPALADERLLEAWDRLGERCFPGLATFAAFRCEPLATPPAGSSARGRA